ncbi:MAG: hypothetical protein WDM92_05930 [Caulobacteraceae bacterium]
MAKYQPNLDLDAVVAIDVHTHAEVSSRQPRDPCGVIFDEAMAKYFKQMHRRPSPRSPGTTRDRKMAA